MRAFLLFALIVMGTRLSYSQTQPAAKKPVAGKATVTKANPPKSKAAARPKSAAPPTLVTDDQKILYALGLSIHHSLAQFSLTPSELELVKRAISDAAANKPAEDLSVWGPKIQGLAKARSSAASEAFLAKAAGEANAIKTPTGLIYRELTPGSGPSPQASDTVQVNYRGTLVDGSVFDSSKDKPAEFPLSGVIACWTQGVQMMKVGGKSQLVCPASLAYGEQGRPGIPPNATLIFEIELLKIVGPKTP